MASDEEGVAVWGRYLRAVCAAGGWGILHQAVRLLLPRVSKQFSEKGENKQRRVELTVLGTINATGIATFAGYKLWSNTSHSGVLEVMEILTGYFMHDFVATRPDWRTHRDELLHHVFSLSISISCLSADELFDVFPSFMLMEISTIFLHASWYLREFKLPGSERMKSVVMPLFAASFFLLRVVWLPVNVFLVTTRSPKAVKLLGSKGMVGLYFSILLNWYWFFKIIMVWKSNWLRTKLADLVVRWGIASG